MSLSIMTTNGEIHVPTSFMGGVFDEILNKINDLEIDLREKIKQAQESASEGINKADNAQNTANNAMPYSRITNSGSINAFGQYAVDGVHLNAGVQGTIMNHIMNIINKLNLVSISDNQNICSYYDDTPGSSYEDCLRNKCLNIRAKGRGGAFLISGGWQGYEHGASIGFSNADRIFLLNISSNDCGIYVLEPGQASGSFHRLY